MKKICIILCLISSPYLIGMDKIRCNNSKIARAIYQEICLRQLFTREEIAQAVDPEAPTPNNIQAVLDKHSGDEKELVMAIFRKIVAPSNADPE